MKLWVREVIATVICAVLLIPSAFIGSLLSMLLYFIYNDIMFLNIPDWLNVFAPSFLGGAIAGTLAVYISFRLLKPQKRGFFLAAPLLLMAVSIIGSVVGVQILDNTWEDTLAPISNSIGVLVGVFYISGELFKNDIPSEPPMPPD